MDVLSYARCFVFQDMRNYDLTEIYGYKNGYIFLKKL